MIGNRRVFVSAGSLLRAVVTASLALLMVGCMTMAETTHKPLDPAWTRGEMDARSDLRAGRLALRSFALSPFGVISPWQRLQYERLGIEVEIVGTFVVDGPIVTETAAYNRVMRQEIRERFGAAVIEQIERPMPAPPIEPSAPR